MAFCVLPREVPNAACCVAEKGTMRHSVWYDKCMADYSCGIPIVIAKLRILACSNPGRECWIAANAWMLCFRPSISAEVRSLTLSASNPL